jgi:PX domain-containing protein kinase-like protein
MTTITDDGAAIFKEESKRRLFSFIIKDTITHPYICAPVYAQLRDSKSVVITPFQTLGSLRDLIYITPEMKKKKITPKSKHFEKYHGANGGKPLDVSLIAKYGRQILEALFYLYLHGFSYPHLHTGNVLITENDHAQLTDLENSLLCLDPKLNREIKKLLVTNADMAPEVICFGHVLYEMAMGHEKGDRMLKEAKAKCPESLFPILESILEPPAPDSAATLKSLLRLPFFQEVTLDVTVHQVVLTEKWDDRARAILKLVRAANTKITTPPVQPLLRSSTSAIKLSSGSSASLNAPTTTHSKSSKTASSSSSASSSASSSNSSSSVARKPSSRTIAKSSTSSGTSSTAASTTAPKAPPPPSAPSPPPPPPPSMAKMPAPQNGRDNLMAAIRAAGGLKAVQKD